MYTASLQKKATSLFSLTMAILLSLGLLTGLLLFTSEVQAQSGEIYYVDRSAAGAATGLNWANAYTDLQDALITATWGAEIWVAAGVYTPGITVSDTFSIPSGVAVYGGFPTGGGDGTFSARDWRAYPTVLSGDIDGDDTNTDGNYIAEDWFDIQGDNAYHVVFMDGTTTPITESTRLDGFTLTAGRANESSYPDGNGGGLFCKGINSGECSPTLINVTFSGNEAYAGGGMYADTSYYGASDPVLTDVLFSGNYAPNGGGIYINGYWRGTSDPVLTGVLFSGNHASDGGGMYLSALISATCNASLTNVTFQGNYAPSGGGMVNRSYDSGTARLILTNVTFAGNNAHAGGAIYNSGTPTSTSSISLTNTILWGNIDRSIASVQIRNEHGSLALSHTLIQSATQAISNTGITTVTYGSGMLTDDPLFVAPITATAAPTTTGNYRLQAGSPAIDAGDNAAITVTTDLEGSARFVDGDGDGNAVVDMGAYETRVDLALAKTADPDPAIAGRWLTYTLVVTNQGTIPATALLSDTLPPSVTLRTLDQTDNVESEFDAGTHDNTTWFDPGRWADDRLTLSDTLQATGVFTSRVFDAGNVVSWDTLAWTPRRPTGKPLPDNGAAETAYALGDVNMAGNRVLLHLDDTTAPFADTSGHANDGSCTACPATGADGRFNDALAFDGVDDVVTVPDAHDPARYALEAWVYPETVTDTSVILRTDAPTETVESYSHLLGIVDGHFQHTVYDGAYRTITATTPVTPNRWYHLVGTAQSGGDLTLYINGDREAQMSGLGPLWTGGDHYRLGAAYGVTGTTPFHGRLDEVAVYSRTLSAAEVTDHYLRGALQLDFKVRTCEQSDCSDDGIWHGPYSEESHTGLDLPTVTFAPPLPDYRYAQYRATLTTADPAYAPALRRVAFGPEHYDVTAEPTGQCTATGGDFTCTLDALPASGIVTVTARTYIHHAALGPITNTASVTVTGEISPTDNVITATTQVTSEVDLTVAKYDDDRDLPYWHDATHGMADPVNPGSPMTYTLLVHNHGPSTAWDVTVTDTLPITPTSIVAPDGWTCATVSRTLSCTTTALSPWHWDAIVLSGAAPLVSGTLTNTGTITSTGSIVRPGSRLSDTITTTIVPLADLTIAKTAAPDPVNPGETLTFTVHVTNTGPYTATGVVVTDTLPADLTGYPIAGAEWASCSTPGARVACALAGDLGPTGSASLQITVTAPLSGLIENTAVVTSTVRDPYVEDNATRIYAAVRPVADLSVAKHDTPDPVDAAATLTYTVVVTNAGPVDAGALTTTVSVRTHRNIRVPIGGTSWPYPSSLWLNSVPGHVRGLTVTLYGLQHTYPADLVALLTGPGGQSTVLMAEAGGGTDADYLTLTFHETGASLPVNDPLTTTTYRPTNYGFGESLPAPAPAGPYGSGFTPFYGGSPNGPWRLYVYDTFNSDGGRIANGWGLEVVAVTTDTVTLSDTLPAGLTPPTVSAPTGWTCTTGDDVLCEALRLNRHETVTVTLAATAPITAGVITNTARVTSTLADFNLARNTVRITTTVNPVADLGIAKTVTPTPTVPQGHALTYTLAISNAGPSPLNSTVTVTDALPATLDPVEITAPGWTCATGAIVGTIRPLTCTLNGLDVGPAPEIVITATAPSTTGLVLRNAAGVTAAASDPITLNNRSVVTVTVGDIAITGLSATNDSPTALGSLTHLEAAVSTGTNVVYTWAFGDGTTGVGTPISYTYPTTGTFTAIVTATNSVSQQSATTTVQIIERYRIYLPLIMRNYVAAPDLIVEAIVATPDHIQVVIRNVGDGPVEDGFWVDAYVDPSPAPTTVNQTWKHLGDQGVVWGVTVELAAGEALTLTETSVYYRPAESNLTWPLAEGTPIYAQVDSAHADTAYGGVLENHEILGMPYNNIAGPTAVDGLTSYSQVTPTESNAPAPASTLPPRQR